ncbi:hypothetical protein RHSIM_Rhsim05G0207200 [Rhododendron simsii]|uniref:Uncharacterized protein n=1 Tax=Rhododendron simsii TaxID=118357 RepID=A0A834LMF6_RHOSS|nr:hypothetical protein RHSIM_Rhsim05G0207200 [Rhododendron simsii]
MSQQLQYFNQYKAKLQNIVGRNRATGQIKAAIFYVNAGSADFALNYFQDDFNYFDDANGPQTSSPLPEYEQILLKLIQRFIQLKAKIHLSETVSQMDCYHRDAHLRDPSFSVINPQLQSNCAPTIHRDLKAMNILLNEDVEAPITYLAKYLAVIPRTSQFKLPEPISF